MWNCLYTFPPTQKHKALFISLIRRNCFKRLPFNERRRCHLTLLQLLQMPENSNGNNWNIRRISSGREKNDKIVGTRVEMWKGWGKWWKLLNMYESIKILYIHSVPFEMYKKGNIPTNHFWWQSVSQSVRQAGRQTASYVSVCGCVLV